jgi:type 1 glutamine amidotransferase
MRALVVSGGWAHPTEQTTPPVVAALEAEGYDVAVTEDLAEGADALNGLDYDLLVVNALFFSMSDERYTPEIRAEWARPASQAWRDAVESHVAAGRPLLALHSAPICFDDWPRWGQIIGGAWNWERSMHPPPGRFTVDTVSDHPVVAGLGSFEVTDERYSFLELVDDIDVHAVARDGDNTHQIVWTRKEGDAPVAYSALGHDASTYETPANRVMLRRIIRHLGGASDEEIMETTDA